MQLPVFGAGSSGFNANTALRRCADDWTSRYDPDIITSVHRNFYVDDFITSVPDEATAINLVAQINRLLVDGVFRLHTWLSKSRTVISSVPNSERAGLIKEISSQSDLHRTGHWDLTGMYSVMGLFSTST